MIEDFFSAYGSRKLLFYYQEVQLVNTFISYFSQKYKSHILKLMKTEPNMCFVPDLHSFPWKLILLYGLSECSVWAEKIVHYKWQCRGRNRESFFLFVGNEIEKNPPIVLFFNLVLVNNNLSDGYMAIQMVCAIKMNIVSNSLN